ncbi:TPA: hypothetical protein QIF01_004940 [Serratia marcescens]|nr:hypothetical protein [Serratia marcescens]
MTQTLAIERLREIATDGFLEHGDAKLMARELLANREAQPVAYIGAQMLEDLTDGARSCGRVWVRSKDELSADDRLALYTAPPAPAVPDAISTRQAIANMERHELCSSINVAYKHGWNDFRAAMLAQPVSQGYKLVPVEPTPKQWAAGVKVMDTGMDKVTLVYKAMLAAAPEGGNG